LDQLGSRLNVLEKSGRAQMEFGGGHTAHTHSHQNMKFLFPPNIHVYQAIAIHISIIMHEIHPCLQHAKSRKTPQKSPPGVLSGDMYTPLFLLFRWWSDQLGSWFMF